MSGTQANTVDDFLNETKIQLTAYDKIFPDRNSIAYSGMKITVDRAVSYKLQVDGKTIGNFSAEKTIGNIIAENNITLGRLDKVSPDINSRPQNNAIIAITRIDVEEKTIPEDIDFKTITNTDSKMGWREKRVTQKGEKGIKEIKYKITYKDGKEVSHVVLEKNVTKEPVTEIVTQGTFVKTGKANAGQGTWYVFQGGLFAASTSIPRGGFARVTNTANGKSVIVEINDYGPQGKGRIIDLDKIAFQKIASLGAGVIGVKVEEILN